MDIYEVEERKQGSQVGMWWWKQAGIDLTMEREAAETADENGL